MEKKSQTNFVLEAVLNGMTFYMWKMPFGSTYNLTCIIPKAPRELWSHRLWSVLVWCLDTSVVATHSVFTGTLYSWDED